MKPKLLYYSDCTFFAGCEIVLDNLINDKKINQEFSVFYSYRYSKKYQDGVSRYFPKSVRKIPLALLSTDSILYNFSYSNRHYLLKSIIGRLFRILQLTQLPLLYNLFRFYSLFKRVKPDILHINNGGYPGAMTCQIAVFGAKMARVKRVIYSVNNLALPQTSRFESLQDKIVNVIVNKFVTASKLAGERLVKNRHFDRRHVIQIYNAVKQPLLQHTHEEMFSLFGLHKKKHILVQVALLEERKGQIYLLKALNAIRNKDNNLFNDTLVVFVGDGPDKAKLEQYVLDNQLTKNVVFTGFRKDYLDFINLADIFLLPSIAKEDMPLVILSAMYLKKSIISTTVGGISEQLENNVEGILLDPTELGKLPEVIINLIKNPERRRHFGERASQKYNRLFSYEHVINQYLNLYHSL